MCTFTIFFTIQGCLSILSSCYYVGGNQRELARAKNAKKQAAHAKGKSDKDGSKGQGLEQRKQRDADIMREKQKKAADPKK